MAVDNWQELKCLSCGGSDFVTVVGYRWHSRGGATPAQKGFACLDCKRPADAAQMSRKMQLEQRKQEYDSLLQEMEAEVQREAQESSSDSTTLHTS